MSLILYMAQQADLGLGSQGFLQRGNTYKGTAGLLLLTGFASPED